MNLFIVKKLILVYIYYLKLGLNHTIKPIKNQVIFFNTYDKGGGAAKICYQLFYSVSDSYLFVKEKRLLNKDIYEFESDLWNRIGEYARKVEKKIGLLDFGKIGVIKLLLNVVFQKSSIIHLHNCHGYYLSLYAFQKITSNKKIVWTLHDDYILTGHCSSSMSCQRWMNGCGTCPALDVYPSLEKDTTQINLKEKIKIIKKLQPYIVTPSQWLANKVKFQFPFLKNIEVINNGVDTAVFHTYDKKKVRIELGLPLDKTLVLYVAEFSTSNPFKGGYILREIIADRTFSDINFITVGGEEESEFLNHISFPFISDDIVLSKLYAACDVLLYPTQADNLPLVVLESMACGTPVIASKIGGIPEIIDVSNGILIIDYKNVNAFKNGLLDFLSYSESKLTIIKENALNTINEKFLLSQMVSSYKRIYAQ